MGTFNPFGPGGGGGGQGPAGKDGKGIESIVWISSTGGNEPGIEGATDTYQINYTKGSPTTYEVTNGSKGSTGQTGAQGVPGPTGPAGPEGPAGQDGKNGAGIDQLYILSGDLYATYTDGAEPVNLGRVVGSTGATGETGPAGADGADGKDGKDGTDGEDGVGIASITGPVTVGLVDTYTINYTNGTSTTFTVTNGEAGSRGPSGTNGRSITLITFSGNSEGGNEPGLPGLTDTYVITYSDNTSSTFIVTNGNNGAAGATGATGATGNGIASITGPVSAGLVDTYTINYTNGNTATFTVTNGANGTNGTDGTDGTNGTDGVGITSIVKTSTLDNVDTYTITFTNGNTTTFTVTNGTNGTNGTDGTDGTDGISITGAAVNASGHLIITLSNNQSLDAGVVKGADGTSVIIKGELSSSSQLPSTGQAMGDCYVINGHLWVYTNSSDPAAVNGFIDAGNLQGPAGNGISSITKTGTSGLVDTYTITYTNGNSDTFTVTNGANGTDGTDGQDGAPGQDGQDGADGKSAYDIWLDAGNIGTEADFLASLIGAAGQNGSDGRGIVSVAKTATVDNIDTYTITYTSGSSSTFTVTNGINGTNGQDGATGPAGRGITSITKTSTSDLIDTYTITYSNNTTSTFTVTNGADGQTGQTGPAGADGADGDDGISITGATINANKHLIVSFSEGADVDAGDVTIRSEQYSFVLSAANWVQQQDGSYNYTYTNAAINTTNFIDVGPAAGITENQLNGLLGAKMIIQAINNGSIVFKAYGEQPSVDIPMLLVVEGSYTSVTPVITVDDTLSLVSENPVQNKVLTAALNDKADAADLDALNAKCASSEISDNLISLGKVTLGTGYSGALRSDGSIIASADGSQRGGTGTFDIEVTNTLPAGTYKFSGCSGGASGTYYMCLYEKNGGQLAVVYNNPVTFTLNAPTEVEVIIVATGGTQFTDKLFYPMVSDASIASPTFSRATVDDGFQRIGGHDRIDVVLGNKAYYLIRYTVISRNTPGQVIKTGYYWIETSSGVNNSTSITDTTNGPEGSPNFNLYYDSNGAKCVRVTDVYNNRDIMLEIMGY